MRRAALALIAAAVSLAAGTAASQPAPPQVGQVSKDSVWVPTPERMIRRMLQLADVTPDDLVVDLGAGDGRIPVYAAKHFGARAIGVELEANLVGLSIESATAQGVSHLARFVQQDLFDFDLSGATVIALYISPAVMTKLKPRLLGLKPGTRVVSHHFILGEWEPDETVRVEDRTGYLWVVPADVRGRLDRHDGGRSAESNDRTEPPAADDPGRARGLGGSGDRCAPARHRDRLYFVRRRRERAPVPRSRRGRTDERRFGRARIPAPALVRSQGLKEGNAGGHPTYNRRATAAPRGGPDERKGRHHGLRADRNRRLPVLPHRLRRHLRRGDHRSRARARSTATSRSRRARACASAT